MGRLPLALSLLLAVPSLASAETQLLAPDVDTYTSQDQVTSVNQFSDVYPSDWAYQSLIVLVERYGCVSGYPDSSFLGNRPITRFEAAALLNSCLEQITTITDEINRLILEFNSELSLLKGRVDGLESRVATLESTQFSTTTKLKGSVAFLAGASKYAGSGASNVSSGRRNSELPNFGAGPTDGFHVVYDLRLDLDTSFTGKDLLKTRLEAGNMNSSTFGYGSATPVSYYSWFFPVGGVDNQLYISRLYYSFPIGNSFKITAGPRVRQDDLLGTWPGLYPTDFPLFGMPIYAGSVGAYNLNLGAGASITWNQSLGSSDFLATALYVAQNGSSSNPSQGGIATSNSAASGSVQLALKDELWNIAAVWTHNQPGNYMGIGTPLWNKPSDSPTNSYGLGGYYIFSAYNKYLPIFNAGAGITNFASDDPYDREQAASWYVALSWPSLFAEGQDLGMSLGQPTFITDTANNSQDDSGYFFDLYYKVPVTDSITITPAIQWASRPYGASTESITGKDDFGVLTFMLKSSFKF